MEHYTVRLTSQAEEQLIEIGRYISLTLQAPDTAHSLLSILECEISSLSLFPNRVALTEEEPWHSYGVRKLPVKHYLVYFWVDEEAKSVLISAIVHGRQDQKRQLLNIRETPWSN